MILDSSTMTEADIMSEIDKMLYGDIVGAEALIDRVLDKESNERERHECSAESTKQTADNQA